MTSPKFTIRDDLPFTLGDDVHLKRMVRDRKDLDALVWLLERWCTPTPSKAQLYALTMPELKLLLDPLLESLMAADAKWKADERTATGSTETAPSSLRTAPGPKAH